MEIAELAAIVTGGGSGLGAATVRLLARRGARVTIIDRDPVAGERIARETGGLFVGADVCDETEVREAIAAGEAAHGVARILVNCAGISELVPTVDEHGAAHSLVTFRRVIDINLIGTFNVLSQYAARLCTADMIDEERGVIVNTSSIAAYDGVAGQAAYIWRRAIFGLSRSLRGHFSARWSMRCRRTTRRRWPRSSRTRAGSASPTSSRGSSNA